jgi:hypothetical protein
MADVHRTIPVTLEVWGDPAGLDLEALGRAVEEAVVGQLQRANDTAPARPVLPADGGPP